MKMKKLMGTLAVGALAATLAIGGTLAYLTDREAETNVFTVGDVAIDLEEDFEQGAQLLPGVKIEKTPTITNTGNTDAYVWMTVAIPSALEEYTGAGEGGASNIIHWNCLGSTWSGVDNAKYFEGDLAKGVFAEDFTLEDLEAAVKAGGTWQVNPADTFKTAMIGEAGEEIEYNVYTLLYNKALKSEETTLPSFYQVYLDSFVDVDPNGDMYLVKEGVVTETNWNVNEDGAPKIYVSAYAMQAEGFDDVNAAYAAYGTQWGENGGVEYDVTAVAVTNMEELTAALADFTEGGTIYLKDGDYALAEGTTIPAGVSLIASGDNANLTIPAPTTTNTSAIVLGDNVTLKGFNIADNGEGIGMGDAGLVTVKGENVVIEDCSFDISGTNASAIALGGDAVNTTIKGCDFVGGYKHIGPAPGTTGGIVIDDCTFDGENSTYAIHLNATKNDVVIKNSTIGLFNTFFGHGNDAGKLVFENCDFIAVPGKTNVVKLYRDAEFINCDFEADFLFSDANKDIAVDFVGGSWGEGTIKDHFLADSFGYNITATFDGDVWYWNTTSDKWEDK